MNSDRSTTIPFKCPQCGHQVFKLDAERHDRGEFVGAVCASCGYTVDDEQVIRAQALQIAEDKISAALSDALGKAFKKR